MCTWQVPCWLTITLDFQVLDSQAMYIGFLGESRKSYLGRKCSHIRPLVVQNFTCSPLLWGVFGSLDTKKGMCLHSNLGLSSIGFIGGICFLKTWMHVLWDLRPRFLGLIRFRVQHVYIYAQCMCLSKLGQILFQNSKALVPHKQISKLHFLNKNWRKITIELWFYKRFLQTNTTHKIALMDYMFECSEA